MYDQILKKDIIDHEGHEFLTFAVVQEKLCSAHVISCINVVEYASNTINIRCLVSLHDQQCKWKTFLNGSALILHKIKWLQLSHLQAFTLSEVSLSKTSNSSMKGALDPNSDLPAVGGKLNYPC